MIDNSFKNCYAPVDSSIAHPPAPPPSIVFFSKNWQILQNKWQKELVKCPGMITKMKANLPSQGSSRINITQEIICHNEKMTFTITLSVP